jgi:hypothetical protein
MVGPLSGFICFGFTLEPVSVRVLDDGADG